MTTFPSASPSMSGQDDRQRDSLFLLARIRVGATGTEREVRVRNLSEGGLMVEMERSAPIGEAVTLEVRGVGRIAGKVAWAESGRMGIAFEQPIDPKLARKPVGAGKTATLYAKAPPRR